MDLRADWAGALPGAGFDPAAPSVWLVEGLLFYLPPAAETYLIDTVDRLTPGGGALAYEVKLEKDLLAYRDSPLYTATRQRIGIDLLDLFDGSRDPTPRGVWRPGLVHLGPHSLRLHPPARTRAAARAERRAGRQPVVFAHKP